MRPIPLKMREELAELPRMKKCAVANMGFGDCEQKIDFDHVWIYAGRQINRLWAIIGVCRGHHREKEGNHLIREAIMRASLRLATMADLEEFPRKNWRQIITSLGMTKP